MTADDPERSALAIAVAALKQCAAFNDGPEVHSGFDEPCAARISRGALGEMETLLGRKL